MIFQDVGLRFVRLLHWCKHELPTYTFPHRYSRLCGRLTRVCDVQPCFVRQAHLAGGGGRGSWRRVCRLRECHLNCLVRCFLSPVTSSIAAQSNAVWDKMVTESTILSLRYTRGACSLRGGTTCTISIVVFGQSMFWSPFREPPPIVTSFDKYDGKLCPSQEVCDSK